MLAEVSELLRAASSGCSIVNRVAYLCRIQVRCNSIVGQHTRFVNLRFHHLIEPAVSRGSLSAGSYALEMLVATHGSELDAADCISTLSFWWKRYPY